MYIFTCIRPEGFTHIYLVRFIHAYKYVHVYIYSSMYALMHV